MELEIQGRTEWKGAKIQISAVLHNPIKLILLADTKRTLLLIGNSSSGFNGVYIFWHTFGVTVIWAPISLYTSQAVILFL